MGLINIKESHGSSNINIAQYFKSSTRNKVTLIREHEERKPQNTSIIKLGTNFIQKVGNELRNQLENEENRATKIAKRSRNLYMRHVHKAFEEGLGNNKRAHFINTELDK